MPRNGQSRMSEAEQNFSLEDEIAQFYDDPLGFVLYAFPWSETGTLLEEAEGPRRWQWEFLEQWGEEIKKRGFDGITPCEPIQFSFASGHGIGKSALSAWITLFIMSTRPYSKGVVTATTSPQLRTKTWAEVGKWKKLCITGHWFKYNNSHGNMNLTQIEHPDTWRVDAQTSREENSESFAGLHAASSTPWYLFDEASGVPDKIFEVSEGGLTDGEPMRFMFGNPTKTTGYFRKTFGALRHRFITRQIDSRTVRGTNKDLFDAWAKDYGEDSDFFRIRVLGQFPRASSLQFISNELAEEAARRTDFRDEKAPIVIGVDVARYGDDASVIYVRQGRDGRKHGFKMYRELDSIQLAGRVAEYIDQLKPSKVFVDGTGGYGSGVVDQLNANGYSRVVDDIQFGAKPIDMDIYFNKRAEMYGLMKEWLKTGLIPDEQALIDDLTGVEYGFAKENKIQLEKKEDMKRRGLASPDISDALALTFAFPVSNAVKKPLEVNTKWVV